MVCFKLLQRGRQEGELWLGNIAPGTNHAISANAGMIDGVFFPAIDTLPWLCSVVIVDWQIGFFVRGVGAGGQAAPMEQKGQKKKESSAC